MAIEVRSLATSYPRAARIAAHRHPWGQLVFAISGVMRVTMAGREWVVPPARAVLAPAAVEHEIAGVGAFAMRTLYLSPRLSRLAALSEPFAIDVGPLLRALIVEVVAVGALEGGNGLHRGYIRILLDQLARAPRLPLSLPVPVDGRARAIAERLGADPSDSALLAELSRDAAASERTVQRLFREETGLRFTEWRRRLRLLRAAELLGEGAQVTEAALATGYASTSAFVAAFGKEMGVTPGQFRRRGGE